MPLKFAGLLLLCICSFPPNPCWAKNELPSLTLTPDNLNNAEQTYSPKAYKDITAWQNMISTERLQSDWRTLYKINAFFNQMHFIDDKQHWKKKDYWATPVEFLGTQGGDCEDFAIAKYLSLRTMGIPAKKLRLMHVNSPKLPQAHMVLLYFESVESPPFVLDNITHKILPINKRPDLSGTFSFNELGLWIKDEHGEEKQLKDSPNMGAWRELLARIKKGK